MDERMEKAAINPNNGNGNKTNTFNLIIGIATLLIAILGATFAYFSATARGNENDVTVKSAFVSISYDGGTEIKATNLIPATIQVALNKYERTDIRAYDPTVDIDGIQTDYDDYAEGDVNRRCVDARGKEVCYVYQFSIKSDSVAEYTDILAYIDINTNEFDNLSYVLYEVFYETELDENQEEKIITDKYGIGLVRQYKLVSEFSNFDNNDYNVDFKNYGFEKFEKPEEILNDDGSFGGYVEPVACLFGLSDDYETKAINDPTRCKKYSMINYNLVGDGENVRKEVIKHYYQLVIWLNETGEIQEEQGKLFGGTVVIEVSGGLDAADYEDGKITGIQ